MTDPIHLAGKLVGIDIPGTSLDPQTLEHLLRHRFGGVCVFRKNIESRAQLARLVAQIREALPEAWVSIDQEGGAVLRTSEVATRDPHTRHSSEVATRDPHTRHSTDLPDPPAAMALGAAGDAELAREVGAATARGLISLGVNWNYAPVLDVNVNPANPVIGDRSFGSDPARVAELALAWAEGSQAEGVAATAKHFPGHGDTALDSHLALPKVDKPLAVLEQTELLPFRRAVERGVASVMTAHIVYSALDPRNPATLSERVLTGLLREAWGYDGVVVTDSMGMKAIADHYPDGGAAVRSVRAGADVVLALGARETQVRQVEALARAIDEGSISPERLNASHRRLDRLAARFPGSPRPYPPQAEAADRRLVAEAALRGVTAVGEVRLPRPGDRVLLVMAEAALGENVYEPGPTVERFAQALGRRFDRLAVLAFPRENPAFALPQLAQAAAGADFLIYASTSRGPLAGDELELARRVFAHGKPALHLALWNPYHAASLGQPALLSYGFRAPSLEALAAVLAGEPARGRLPVRLS